MKTSEVAKRLGVCEKTVRRLATDGHIPCRVIPGRKKIYIFDQSNIKKFLSGEAVDQKSYRINL